jgi:hypothetical protein
MALKSEIFGFSSELVNVCAIVYHGIFASKNFAVVLSWSNCLVLFRVLVQVDFESKFGLLPQFNPDDSESGTPLTRSPRDIINSFKKRQKRALRECITRFKIVVG